MTDVLRWCLIVLSIPLFVLMVVQTVRRARELDHRIDEFHAEQEAAQNQPGPINPYDQLAQVFGGQAIRRAQDDGDGGQGADSSVPTPNTQHPTPGSTP